MARIVLPVTPLVSRRFIGALQQTLDLRDDLIRLKDIADEITGGGVNKNALENAVEVIGSGPALAAGHGAIIYDAIVSLLSGPNAVGIKNIAKQFDQG